MCVMQKESLRPLSERTHLDVEGWARCERLNKYEADELLDWLEANGYAEREVFVDEEGRFTVRWHR